jgi:hypothetical protein
LYFFVKKRRDRFGKGNSQGKGKATPQALTIQSVSVERNTMNTGRLRQLWATIEETDARRLHGLNDTDLIQQVLKQLNTRHALSGEESQVIVSYLKMRLPLIRDMA